MSEINTFTPYIDQADIGGDDVMLLWNAATARSAGVTRSVLLHDVARQGGDHNFGQSEITSLTATTASIGTMVINTSMRVGTSGAEISRMRAGSETIVVPDLAAGAGYSSDITTTGAVSSDLIVASVQAQLPDGLTLQAWVSAPDTVTARFFNTTGAQIDTASYAVKVLALAVS